MDEPDQRPMRSGTGNLIQQLPTRGGRLGEGGAYVIGRKGNVMDGLAPVLQELLDLRLGVQGRNQLDPTFSNRDHGDLDPLVLEPFPATGPKPKPPLIDLDRLIEIANRDSHVIDPAQHWLILKAALDASPIGPSCPVRRAVHPL